MKLEQLSFEPMNEVHNQEAKILKRLLDAIKKREKLDEIYDEFLKDVENHFKFENKLMNEYGFFAKIPHTMEHDRVLNELYEIKNYLNDYEKVEKYFNEVFVPWLNNHIATMDNASANFFSELRYKNLI